MATDGTDPNSEDVPPTSDAERSDERAVAHAIVDLLWESPQALPLTELRQALQLRCSEIAVSRWTDRTLQRAIENVVGIKQAHQEGADLTVDGLAKRLGGKVGGWGRFSFLVARAKVLAEQSTFARDQQEKTKVKDATPAPEEGGESPERIEDPRHTSSLSIVPLATHQAVVQGMQEQQRQMIAALDHSWGEKWQALESHSAARIDELKASHVKEVTSLTTSHNSAITAEKRVASAQTLAASAIASLAALTVGITIGGLMVLRTVAHEPLPEPKSTLTATEGAPVTPPTIIPTEGSPKGVTSTPVTPSEEPPKQAADPSPDSP